MCCMGLCFATTTIGTRCPVWTDDEAFMEHLKEEIEQEGYTLYSSMEEAQNAVNENGKTPQQQPAVAPATEVKEQPKPVKTCNHNYAVKVVTEATCSEKGKLEFTCTKCGDKYSEVTAATGKHEYTESITSEATCTENGIKTFKCNNCDTSYTEEISAVGHYYTDKITKQPTCTENGINTFTCMNCGDSYTEEINAVGHTLGEWGIVKANGLFKEGVKEQRCNTCGKVINTASIPSTYPVSVLYMIIGIVSVLIIGVIALILGAKKKDKNNKVLQHATN